MKWGIMTEMVEGNEGIMVVFGLNRNFIVEDAHAPWLVSAVPPLMYWYHWNPLANRTGLFIVRIILCLIYDVNYAMPCLYDQINWRENNYLGIVTFFYYLVYKIWTWKVNYQLNRPPKFLFCMTILCFKLFSKKIPLKNLDNTLNKVFTWLIRHKWRLLINWNEVTIRHVVTGSSFYKKKKVFTWRNLIYKMWISTWE